MTERRTGMRGLLPILIAVLSLVPRGAPAADAFYLDLLRDGTRAYERGEFEIAAKSLRIACFGFLNDPDLLTEGLVRLALAQARMADEDGFEASFRRLVEVEERVGGYSQAELPAPLRSEFELELIARIPPGELAGSGAFERLAEMALAPTPIDPEASREDLTRRARESPADPAVLLRLAEMDLEAGRAKQSLKWLKKLDAAGSGLDQARCLRGQSRLQLKQCQQAMAELAQCPSFSPSQSPLAVSYLGCLVEAGSWDQAADLLAAFPASATADPRTAGLAAKVARARSEPPPGTDAPQLAGASRQVPERAPAGPVRDQQELKELRSLLASATTVQELRELLERTRSIVASDPSWSDARFLAGEIAYHAARWDEAVELFQQGEEPGPDRPDLRFYLAVSLYESGNAEDAARLLEDILPKLESSPFVDSYAAKILGQSQERP